MPLWFYPPLHPQARLSDADRSTITDWARARQAEFGARPEVHDEHEDDTRR
jgi:hypothetical protein